MRRSKPLSCARHQGEKKESDKIPIVFNELKWKQLVIIPVLLMEWEGRHSSPSSERSLEKTREGVFELEPGSRLSETIRASGSRS